MRDGVELQKDQREVEPDGAHRNPTARQSAPHPAGEVEDARTRTAAEAEAAAQLVVDDKWMHDGTKRRALSDDGHRKHVAPLLRRGPARGISGRQEARKGKNVPVSPWNGSTGNVATSEILHSSAHAAPARQHWHLCQRSTTTYLKTPAVLPWKSSPMLSMMGLPSRSPFFTLAHELDRVQPGYAMGDGNAGSRFDTLWRKASAV
ncbi:hypothetical protein GGX14DRAFT_399267 [Mycena pura]|uniref:Uncharacterized protein n=1 Tax=Mycena pura TaxID=153505 RepID=A0AAD6V505_9AGAR|nr:hypothetical protein GGX14DRAFT_399267 [Mycena pura]